MTQYALREMLLFGVAVVVAGLIRADLLWTWFALALVLHVGLSMLSTLAFSRAVDRGFVKASRAVVTKFYVHPDCPARLLVKRHILASPAASLRRAS